MKLTRYATVLAFTGAALYAIAGTLYAVTQSATLYALFTIAGTICVIVAIVIAMRIQRRLILEQEQHIARMRALERQLEAMIQQEASKRDDYSN